MKRPAWSRLENWYIIHNFGARPATVADLVQLLVPVAIIVICLAWAVVSVLP